MIILKRVVGHEEGHTMVYVNPDKINFMYGDSFMKGGQLIFTTRIDFDGSFINVLESPDTIEQLIRNYNE